MVLKLLPGDEVIRPKIDLVEASNIVNRVFGLKTQFIKELDSYDDRNFFINVQIEAIDNKYISQADVSYEGYVLKVTNSRDSKISVMIDIQNEIMIHLDRSKIAVSLPIPNKEGSLKVLGLFKNEKLVCTEHDFSFVNDDGSGANYYMLRLLKFVPGKTLYTLEPWTCSILYQCGKFVGRIDEALATFEHIALKSSDIRHDYIWSLNSVPKLKHIIDVLDDVNYKKLVLEIIDEFELNVLPMYDQLERQTIHADCNEQNLLIRKSLVHHSSWEVFGIIDFGDVNYNPVVYELAILIMYLMTKSHPIPSISVGGHVIAGYISEREINDQEFDILKICVAARFVQSLVMGTYTYNIDPRNEYVKTTAKTGWKVLMEFWSMPQLELYKLWKNIMSTYNNMPGQEFDNE